MKALLKGLSKYQGGNFIFDNESKMTQLVKTVNEKPGVYYIFKKKGKKNTILYIGKSGTFSNKLSSFGKQTLRKRLNNTQDGVSRQKYFEQKLAEEHTSKLFFHWFVTYDSNSGMLPAFVEAKLIQQYFRQNKRLPTWNKNF